MDLWHWEEVAAIKIKHKWNLLFNIDTFCMMSVSRSDHLSCCFLLPLSLLLSLLVTTTVTYGWLECRSMTPTKNYHWQSPPTHTCIDICACASGPAYVYMNMHLWVCAHAMYTYACVLSRWQGGSSGGMVGVKHLCGSKPMSGQLQWPMFKVNEGLRWLFIRNPLHSWWTASASPYKHSWSSYTPFSFHPQGLGQKVITHWDPFSTVRNQTLADTFECSHTSDSVQQTHTHKHLYPLCTQAVKK